ncbi:MAG: TetR family transcriptional regulator C-terminal domain-containing protein [Silicimonas sp.]
MSKTASHTKQAQESQRKIDKILSAAEVEFGRKGYDGATIQAIADRAKLSKRQVIHFCRSKPEIYENVFRSIMTDWRGEEVDSEPGEPMELIENYVAVLFQTVRKNPVRSWFIINDMIRGGEGFTRNADETQINALMENRVERLKMWAAEGKIDDAVDPIFIFFMTWALQHFFAVFEPEIAYFLDKDKLDDADWHKIEAQSKNAIQKILSPSA